MFAFFRYHIRKQVELETWLEQHAAGPYRKLFIRVPILLALLAAIALVVVLLVKEKMVYALILAALPLAALLSAYMLKYLAYTPVAVLLAGAFIPFSIPTGRGSNLVIALVASIMLVGYWILKMLIVDKHFQIKPSPVNTPTLGFSLVTLISVLWSTVLRDPNVYVASSFLFVQLVAAIVMVISPGIMLMIANFSNHMRYAKMMVGIMLAVGVIGMVQNLAHVNLFTNTQGLTSMWVVTLCVGISLYQKNLRLIYRAGLLLLGGLWFYWSFFLHRSWLAGWLPCIVAIAVLVFYRSKRLFFLGLILLVLYVAANVAIFSEDISKETAESGQTRLAAWNMNWQITREHLLFGTGPAGYAAYYMAFFPTDAMATHSNYIDIVAQTGILGTIFFFWLFGSLIWVGLRVLKRVRGKRDFNEAVATAIFAGLAACIVIMGFGDWLVPFAYTQTIQGYSYTVYSWLFFGILLMMDQMKVGQEPQKSLPESLQNANDGAAREQ